MSQSRNSNRTSNNSRRNRGDPTREKTYRAQAVMITNSNSSSKGTVSYSQRMKQSKAPNNSSAPTRRNGPPRQSHQVQRQVPKTRKPPASRPQRQPPSRQAPPSRQPPVQQAPHYSHQQRPARPPPPKTYQLQENERFGKVRRVVSGDCLEVYFKERVGDEIRETKSQINLDGIRAPKLLRTARDEQKHGRSDELFAWESREFLRKVVCHQIVVVKSSSDNSNSKNKGKAIYATVKVRQGDMGNRPITEHDTLHDVALLSLEKGLSKVKTEVKDPNPEYVAMEEAAKENETGLWEPQPDLVGRKNDKSWFRSHFRQVTFNPDPVHFFEEHKGKALKGIVEDVTEGTRIKVEIVFQDNQGIKTSQIILNLSGVISPKTGKKPRGREDPEPFGDFARNFTMVRMQHHDVTVYLDAIDKFNNIYGHIEFPKGDIALELIKQGCAKVVPWTAHAIGKLSQYLQCEQIARNNKVRMWSKEQFASLPVYGRQGQGVVKEVTSGDSIQLLVNGNLKRFYLASIQAPRRNNKNRGGPDPFYAEAKEYVRKNLIGKTVKFVVEYQRQVQNQSNKKADKKPDPFNYITLYYDGNRNLNEELIELGFCKAVRHKKTEPRSVGYKKLVELQKNAEDKRIGVFSPPDKLPKPETDYTVTKRRNRSRNNDEDNPVYNEALAYCEARLGFITREERSQNKKPEYRRVPAICEFVFNGERMKVRLVEDNVLCNLILADIRFEKDDKQASEAKAYCKDLISQMEIEVEIERLDRSARFIGHVFYQEDNSSGEMKNLAEELLKRGWALPLKPRMGPGSKHASLYAKALAHAKKEKNGRWENYVEPEPEPEKQRPPRGGDGDEAAAADGQQQQQNQGRKPVGRQRERGQGRGRDRGRDNRGDYEGGERGDRRDRRGRGPRGDRQPRRGGQKNVKIDVTVIEDGVTFFAREKNSKQAKRIEEAMSKINPLDVEFPEGWEPDRNVVCAGLYNDGCYYRCRVMSQKKGSTESRVRWIDFGETGTIQQDLLLPIQNEKGKPRLEEIEPLAKKCKLSGLKTPPENTPYFDEAQHYFVETIRHGNDVRFDVKKEAKNFLLVVLKVDGKEVNDLLVRNGFARVMRTKDNKDDEYIQHLTQLETDAKSLHTGQWEYGDLGSDDEDSNRGGRDRRDKKRGGRGRN